MADAAGVVSDMFKLDGKVAVITGGGGVLGAVLAGGLAKAGARVAVADLFPEKAQAVADQIKGGGAEARAYKMDAMAKDSIEETAEKIYADFGRVDILVNAAGGNMKEATTSPDLSFFDLPLGALEKVIGLNLFGGAILPAQVIGRRMADLADGAVILNISSMNSFRPLTRIPGYSAAKAAVSNFTQWLAVHFAQEYNPKLRVNALAPGFFLTDQNRFLLTSQETGDLTERGKQIIAHTPMGRFGDAEDLIGTALWLVSDAASFVTGIIVPVDGGFSAYSGV